MKGYESALSATSGDHAPWFVIPADHKWYRNWLVAGLLVEALEGLHLSHPKPDPQVNFKKLKIH